MCVVIIPARGGSKRIPRKNIQPFAGRPIIEWSIAAALGIWGCEQVVVSTDDDEIADIASKAGAITPFRRSVELSNDHVGTFEVMCDAVSKLELASSDPVCCLYPTAPMVTSASLEEGRNKLQETGATFVFPVVDFGVRIERGYRRFGDRIKPIDPAMMEARSQDLEAAYFDAGQFYWALAATWRTPSNRIWDDAAPIILPRHTVQDIDTEEDWAIAERLFRFNRAEESAK